MQTDEARANGKAAHHFHADRPRNVNATCTKDTFGCFGSRESGQKMTEAQKQSYGY